MGRTADVRYFTSSYAVKGEAESRTLAEQISLYCCSVQQVQIKCNSLFNLFDEDKLIRSMGAAALARSYFMDGKTSAPGLKG